MIRAIEVVVALVEELTDVGGSVAIDAAQQSAAHCKIARKIDQASTGTRNVPRNIGGVEHVARETGDEDNRINDVSANLTRQVDAPKQDVSRCLLPSE